jgi:hypothetical protein
MALHNWNRHLAKIAVASNPISGIYSQKLPVVETSTLNWGYDIGAYLFVVAAVLRIVGGIIVWTTPELKRASIPENLLLWIYPLPLNI